MNVVLITVDCLRFDHVTEQYMPHLCSLQDRFDVFSSCIATGTKTRDAAQMILTSSYPSHHGGNTRIAGSQTPLSELLQETHTTAFFHSNPLMGREFGYERGFDQFTDFDVISKRNDRIRDQNPLKKTLSDLAQKFGLSSGSPLWDIAERLVKTVEPFERPDDMPYTVADETLAAFEAWKPETEYFGWIHLLDPHTPYIIRDEYLDWDGERAAIDTVAERTFEMDDDGVLEANLSEQEQEAIRALYRAEVRYLDSVLGPFVERLLEADTAVILSADHGEHLFEHDGRFQHHAGLWDELVEVPMLIATPSGKNIHTTRASQVDLAPTIASLLGHEPADSWIGHDLLTEEAPEYIMGEYIQKSGIEPYLVYCDDGENRFGYYPSRDRWISLSPDRTRILEVTPDDVGKAAAHIRQHLSHSSGKANELDQLDEEVEERLADLGYR